MTRLHNASISLLRNESLLGLISNMPRQCWMIHGTGFGVLALNLDVLMVSRARYTQSTRVQAIAQELMMASSTPMESRYFQKRHHAIFDR